MNDNNIEKNIEKNNINIINNNNKNNNMENNNVTPYEIVKCLIIYESAYFCKDLINKYYSTK
jgi:hypothetical protein